MGCDVGRLLRDDQAMLLLQQTLQALPMDWESILQNLTTLAAEAIQADVQVEEHRAARLRQELCQLDRKQEDVLDDFFSGGITREELEIMKRRITRQRAECTARLNAIRQKTSTTKDGSQLQEEIRRHIAAIITGQAGEEVFGRHVLERMVVYRDRRVVVQLHQLPQKWVFCPCGTLTVQTDDGEKLV